MNERRYGFFTREYLIRKVPELTEKRISQLQYYAPSIQAFAAGYLIVNAMRRWEIGVYGENEVFTRLVPVDKNYEERRLVINDDTEKPMRELALMIRTVMAAEKNLLFLERLPVYLDMRTKSGFKRRSNAA